MSFNKQIRKSVFPHRYSKVFQDFWWSKTALWNAWLDRLRTEKDCFILITGDTGCQPKGNKVLMSNGKWKNIENIKIGDEVISPQKDGSNVFSKVKWVTNWECQETYNVVELNKTHKKLYSCSNNHNIPLYHKNVRKKIWNFREYSAEKINKLGDGGLKHNNIGFTSFEIKEFKDKENCKIKPYALGVFLGDGHYCKQLSITTQYKKIMKDIEKFYPVMSLHLKKNNKSKGYMFSLKSDFAKLLEEYGLKNKKSGDKFIPKEALLSDSDYRSKLLAGLIDTDGYYKNGGYEYTSKSKILIENIRDLIYSLGGRTGKIKEIKKSIKSIKFTGTYYSISFYLGKLNIPIKLSHKKRNINTIYLNPNRIAINTKKSSKKRVYGFELESNSHWYITDNWMITKNSGKSHFTGSFCLKHAVKEPNFILNDGSKMFIPRENFIIDPDEFAYKMITKEGQVLWLDEARRVANRRKWFSKINNAVADRKNQNRKLFNIYILCMPFEKEFDPALGSHLTMWVWVRRGVGEVYCKRSGVKGGTGLNIKNILEREEKYLKENPKRTIVMPTIHPEYVGRIAFSKLTAGLEREYKELVKEKKATGDLTDEEKKKYGIVIEVKPENIVMDIIEDIKKGKIKDKKTVWEEMKKVKDTDDKKLKILNFYLKLEGWDTFNKLFSEKKLEDEDIWEI